MLEAADIRYCTNRQLARLLRCEEKDASRLSYGKKRLANSMQSHAVSLGIPLNSLLKGLRLRRKDYNAIARHQSKVDEVLASVGQQP